MLINPLALQKSNGNLISQLKILIQNQAVFLDFEHEYFGPAGDRMHNTYLFGRPGPCPIEWYGCCAFDRLSSFIAAFRRMRTRTRSWLKFMLHGCRWRSRPVEIFPDVRCNVYCTVARRIVFTFNCARASGVLAPSLAEPSGVPSGQWLARRVEATACGSGGCADHGCWQSSAT